MKKLIIILIAVLSINVMAEVDCNVNEYSTSIDIWYTEHGYTMSGSIDKNYTNFIIYGDFGNGVKTKETCKKIDYNKIYCEFVKKDKYGIIMREDKGMLKQSLGEYWHKIMSCKL